MVTLYQFPTAFDLPLSVSPYCAKVEAYLRLTGREYQTEVGVVFKSPNRKVPYLRLPDGSMMADSGDIIARLEQEGPALDGSLSREERADSKHLIGLAQDHLYFGVLHSRFGPEDGWTHQRPTVQAMVPSLLGWALVPIIRKSQLSVCAKAGHVDHESSVERSLPVLRELSDLLSDGRAFLLGEQPHVVDCAVFGPLVAAATWIGVKAP